MSKIVVVLLVLAVGSSSLLGYNYINKMKQGNVKLEEVIIEENKEETEKCLVKFFGVEYDVAAFRKMHPGGDVFKCGSDMTEDFKKQHGEDLERIKRFLKPIDEGKNN